MLSEGLRGLIVDEAAFGFPAASTDGAGDAGEPAVAPFGMGAEGAGVAAVAVDCAGACAGFASAGACPAPIAGGRRCLTAFGSLPTEAR